VGQAAAERILAAISDAKTVVCHLERKARLSRGA
jgi:hypothetical protein